MLPFVTIMSAFLMRPLKGFGSSKAQESATNLLKSRFGDRAVLARDETHLMRRGRRVEAESEVARAGAAARKGASEPTAWREWRWTEVSTVGDCTFREVRWRFYENGRIAFQAEMENRAGNLRIGSIQGHRIELRTSDGCLLGAWRAAFFVRRNCGIRHYPATILDEHPLVPLHFDELAERQSGACYFI